MPWEQLDAELEELFEQESHYELIAKVYSIRKDAQWRAYVLRQCQFPGCSDPQLRRRDTQLCESHTLIRKMARKDLDFANRMGLCTHCRRVNDSQYRKCSACRESKNRSQKKVRNA